MSDSFPTSICICTRNRPARLGALLDSLQAALEGPALEVVVVDNDPAGSADQVADRYAGRFPLRYVREPAAGLTHARNRAIRESHMAWIAFLDDDETVGREWLQAHHRVLASTGADASFGPVRVEFEDTVPHAIRCCRFFQGPAFTEGEPVPWYHTRTSNVVLRRAALPDPITPFRAAFNHTGGEDIDLFKRMSEAGRRFVSAGPGTAVLEYREHDRASLAWALRRSLRNGANLEDLRWPVKRGALSSLGISARHAWRAFRAGSRTGLPFVEHCIDAAEEAGRFLSHFGYRYPEYAPRP